jgi:hypothetical protein
VFVHDVCANENNGKEKEWLDALHGEDIVTYEHLANLRQSEWDNIRKLPMNAKRILKTAIDRERENVASDPCERTTYDSDEKDADNNQMYNNKSKHLDLFQKKSNIQRLI